MDALIKEVAELKALNKKTEQLRMREREYSSKLEMEIDKRMTGKRGVSNNKQV